MKKEVENVPALRFPGYSDEWSKGSLGNFAALNPKITKLPDTFCYIDLESVDKGELVKESLIDLNDAPSRAQRLVSTDDILYQTVRPYQRNNYLFQKKQGKYVASTGYAQIRALGSPGYLYQYIHTDLFVDKVMLRCTGTSYPAINSSDLAAVPISVPSLPEQQKIASFLTAVDDKIQQLKRKKALLEQYKKGVMQQLFGQKLRFKDDQGNEYPDWEEKTLGSVALSISNGLSLTQNDSKDGIRVTRIETIAGKDINLAKVGYVKTTKDVTEYRLEVGDILFSNINSVAHIGKVVLIDQDYDLYHGMNLLRIRIDRANFNPLLIAQILGTKKYKSLFEKICNRAVNQASINQTDLKKTPLIVPCYQEQTKIANFLSAIDDKINNVTQQIDHTRQFKKGLLQQMFV